MGLFEWLSQILQLARQFLLLFKKGLLLISFLVKDNGYQSDVMQYVTVLSCLFFSKSRYINYCLAIQNRLIVSNINIVSGYRKQVRKICASLQTVYLRYNAKSIITVCNGPIVWAVTNFADSEAIFVIIQKRFTVQRSRHTKL